MRPLPNDEKTNNAQKQTNWFYFCFKSFAMKVLAALISNLTSFNKYFFSYTPPYRTHIIYTSRITNYDI